MSSLSKKIIPVVLCGGSGTRLWPLSREKAPKQFHSIISDKSLLHDTLARSVSCSGANAADIITVTADPVQKETIHQLADFNPASITHLINEPMARNTAAAIAYAALYANQHFGPDAILWIIPSDHYIEDEQGLSEAVQQAANIATKGYIATFGMKPSRPETGYGYIKAGKKIDTFDNVQNVSQFVEKPDTETAQQYVDSGDYLWNSGMFIGSVRTILDNFIEYCPEIVGPLNQDLKNHTKVSTETYNILPSIPFDVAIMEKTQKAAVIPCNIGWSDVGAWESVWELKDKDKNGNVTDGNVTTVETENCLIQSNSLLVATMGLKDIVIVENGDSILIADKKNGSAMKTLVNTLKENKATETIHPPMESRPWGQFKVLSESDGYKVKELLVKPGQKLSLQMHNHRCEFWTVISGEALVTINNETRLLKAKENTFIPFKAAHRLENPGTENLVVVEVQCGDYLGEDDIVRFDDVYGRAEAA